MQDINQLIIQNENRKFELKDYPEIKLKIDDTSTFTQVRFIKKNIVLELNGGVNNLFEYIQNNSNQKANTISQNLNVPLRTIQRWLKQLKTEDKIAFIGSPKSGGYFIKEKI